MRCGCGFWIWIGLLRSDNLRNIAPESPRIRMQPLSLRRSKEKTKQIPCQLHRKHNCKLRRNKRKAVKTKSMDRNFETYIQDACTGFRLSHNSGPNTLKDKVDSPEAGDLSIDLDQLRSIWKDNSSSMVQKKVAIFILIQNCLQPVIENLILYDRIVYLKEKGLKNCQFKRIVNERISPRCLALLACK
ncbi:uncharacterized protein LOC133532225 isoform X1 [Cydia pomonella]|uniref:uncharacterized protein LOC133532225 isoform X1 n=1 Tax=Cydia pomonella TaxID=82600 RepID=UPI002ADE54BA|nr:uncharacterized protein LOC133532225 isoform X1 [Cydia pomonella]